MAGQLVKCVSKGDLQVQDVAVLPLLEASCAPLDGVKHDSPRACGGDTSAGQRLGPENRGPGTGCSWGGPRVEPRDAATTVAQVGPSVWRQIAAWGCTRKWDFGQKRTFRAIQLRNQRHRWVQGPVSRESRGAGHPGESVAGADRVAGPTPSVGWLYGQPHLHPQRAPRRLPHAEGETQGEGDLGQGVLKPWCS